MKYFNEKISSFVKWVRTRAKENCAEGELPTYLYTPRAFELYKLESDVPIEDLTDAEIHYLKILYENTYQEYYASGRIRPDCAKFSLQNDLGWTDRERKEEKKVEEEKYVLVFDTKNLSQTSYETTENIDFSNNGEETVNESISKKLESV